MCPLHLLLPLLNPNLLLSITPLPSFAGARPPAASRAIIGAPAPPSSAPQPTASGGEGVFAGWTAGPVLPDVLPDAGLLQQVDLPPTALKGGRYAKCALEGEAGPYTAELSGMESVATATGADRLRSQIGFPSPVNAETFDRSIKAAAQRFLAFNRYINPGPLTLHSYIAHAEEFLLFLTFCLQRNGGKFEEASKQLLVSACA